MLKSKRALSPVVAAIILIAVTVAVSIAVAAWMGALTFTFMGYEKLGITKVTWLWNSDPALRTFTITVNNTGTKDLTIDHVEVNYARISAGSINPTTPYPRKTGEWVDFTITYAYANGTAYDVSVVSASGYKFTDHFIGGQNVGP